AAVQAGVGREVAHEVIKSHAVDVALALRSDGSDSNDLIERLAADPRLGLDVAAVRAAVGEPLSFVGTADRQVAQFVAAVGDLADRYPAAAGYTGEEIL
ncbi:MAG: adenylosuccinate lyase, partial [Actinomycetota bacterium]